MGAAIVEPTRVDADSLPRRIGLLLTISAAVSLLSAVLAYPLAFMAVYGLLPMQSTFMYYLVQGVVGIALWVGVILLLYSLQIWYAQSRRALFVRMPGGIYTVILVALLIPRIFIPGISWHETSEGNFNPQLIFMGLHLLVAALSCGAWMWFATRRAPSATVVITAAAVWLAFDAVLQLRYYVLPYANLLISTVDNLSGSQLVHRFGDTPYVAYLSVDPPLWRHGAGMLVAAAGNIGQDFVVALVVGIGMVMRPRSRGGSPPAIP